MSRTHTPEEITVLSLLTLPSISLLEKAETQRQIYYWHQVKSSYSEVALCWLSTMLNSSTTLESLNDFLYKNVEEKKLDKIYYESAWRRTEKLQALYKILKIGEKYITSACKEYGVYRSFTADDLFRIIIRIDADNDFKHCLEPYKNFSITKVLTETNVIIKLSKSQNLNPQKLGRIKHICTQSINQNGIYAMAMLICQRKAHQDKQLNQALDQYAKAIAREVELDKAILSRTRSSKTFKKPRSFSWVEGEIVYGDRHGGTYKINKTS